MGKRNLAIREMVFDLGCDTVVGMDYVHTALHHGLPHYGR